MAIDVSALATSLVKNGPAVMMSMVNKWDPGADFGILKNVQIPMALPKLSTAGTPRPYRAAKDTSGNDAVFTDRVLTVNQSKWDFNFDPETYRNTYLAAAGTQFDPKNMQFWRYLAMKIMEDYLAQLNDSALYAGVYDSGGTGIADVMDGLVEILTNAGLTPVATGTFDETDAVTKVEQVAEAVPAWMRQGGFKIICSYTAADYYKKHYRTLNGYGFDQGTGTIKLDKMNATLEPRSYMGTSLGLIVLPAKRQAIYIGTDGDSIKVHATPTLNTIDLRFMMPIGMQLADKAAVVINDQLV